MSSRSAAAGKIAPRTMARTRPSTIGSHRSEEHTSELQSQSNLVCRLLLEKKKIFDVLASKYRITYDFLYGTPKLHIFIVTLRLDHYRHYSMVSRHDDAHGTIHIAADRDRS